MSIRPFLALLAATTFFACGDPSEYAPSGLDEPIVVSYTPLATTGPGASRDSRPIQAQFFRGELPIGTEGPATSITFRQSAIFPGTIGKKVGGNAAMDATSVAVKFKGLGTGYWVVPTTLFDAELKGTILWEAQLALSRNIPVGRQTLEAVAFDPNGKIGAKQEAPLFVQPAVPQAPVVASLTWDTNADLDLQIMTPDGDIIDAKHPASSTKVDGGFPPGTGVIDRDSNAGCVIDGVRTENVVWNDYPAAGIYLAKVDMFSACGEPGANFAFRLYIQGEPSEPVAGKLLSIDADNGGPGLAITNFRFQP